MKKFLKKVLCLGLLFSMLLSMVTSTNVQAKKPRIKVKVTNVSKADGRKRSTFKIRVKNESDCNIKVTLESIDYCKTYYASGKTRRSDLVLDRYAEKKYYKIKKGKSKVIKFVVYDSYEDSLMYDEPYKFKITRDSEMYIAVLGKHHYMRSVTYYIKDQEIEMDKIRKW